jgi:excisionase family DNA binding protein
VAARERLLTSGEVAQLFRVDPKTVTRWAAAGRIPSIRTPGGHRRFAESQVRALLRGEPVGQPAMAGPGLDEGLADEPAERAGAAVPTARRPGQTIHEATSRPDPGAARTPA